MKGDGIKEDILISSLKMLAPGTSLREGLENVLKAKTGGLIIIGDSEEVMSIVDGGFNINSDFSTAHLYELAKMDGAIILSRDCKKILLANTQLIPDASIPSSETGIRHRTAERVARQTGELVVSISQRRNIITMYKGYMKYILKDTSIILSKANQALQTLTKYKSVLDRAFINLGAVEYEDMATVHDVATAAQKCEFVIRIANEVDRYIYELGNEGRLVSMQLEELIVGVKEEEVLLIRDYMPQEEGKSCKDIIKLLRNLSSDELLELPSIVKIIGLGSNIGTMDIPLFPRGYRMLSKVPRLPLNIIENLVLKFEKFQNILSASIEQLDDVEGIGEVRAKTIKESLRKMYDQIHTERYL
ncbi:MAG: DNA integrity scanning protein DisA [Clostridiales bacterium GWB2_37_7]|nr:MAG: DNA integrity scanning protein DisA [Clostridiales bacterium GWB2_37_7]